MDNGDGLLILQRTSKKQPGQEAWNGSVFFVQFSASDIICKSFHRGQLSVEKNRKRKYNYTIKSSSVGLGGSTM